MEHFNENSQRLLDVNYFRIRFWYSLLFMNTPFEMCSKKCNKPKDLYIFFDFLIYMKKANGIH